MDILLNKPTRPYEVFHDKTRQNAKKTPQPPAAGKRMETQYKGYPRFERICLPEPVPLPIYSLQDTLVHRKSERKFGSNPLPLSSLSTLLYFSSGLKHMGGYGDGRFYPSAGAKYPIEIYLISLRTAHIPNGLYHYYLKSHGIEKIRELADFKVSDYFNQSWLEQCGVIMILSARFDRTVARYGDRGYRYILMESGHLMQNVHLVAQTLRLSSCAVGGFTDDRLNDLLDLTSSNREKVIYAAGIGSKTKVVTKEKK